MRFRHALLAAAGTAFLYAWLSAVGAVPDVLGYYNQEQMRAGVQIGIALLAAWTLLEGLHHVLRAGAPRCRRCGFSLEGVVCPECGRRAGHGERPEP